MNEQIKNEIRSQIKANRANLITGDILQGVLLDMTTALETGQVVEVATSGSSYTTTVPYSDWTDYPLYMVDNELIYVKSYDEGTGWTLESTRNIYVFNAIAVTVTPKTGGYATLGDLEEVSSSLSQSIADTKSELEQEIRDITIDTSSLATKTELSQSVSHLQDEIDGIVSGSGFVERTEFDQFTGSVASTYATTASLNSVSSSLNNAKVDKSTYNSFSGSVHTELGNKVDTGSFNSFSSSIHEEIQHITIDTSSLVTTGSFNDYTASVSQSLSGKLDKNEAAQTYMTNDTWTTASGSIHDELNGKASTGSVETLSQSLSSSIQSIADLSASLSSSQAQIETISGSLDSKLDTGSFNTFSSSVHQEIQNITIDTSSLVTTGSFNDYTASVSQSLAGKVDTGSFNTYSGSVSQSLATKLDTGSFNDYTGSVASTYATTASLNSVSSSLSSSLAGKADNYSTTYPQNFAGTIDCSYNMNVVVITNSVLASPTLALTNMTAGSIVHSVFISSTDFSGSWALAIPTTITYGQDSLPVYLNGVLLENGDTVTLDSGGTTKEMSILISSISVNIVTF